MKTKKRILIIDNYDSFTYNLVQAVESIQKQKIDVYRNDKITVDQCNQYEYIIVSPGPGIPEESGETLNIIKTYYTQKKIFGVCLGLQTIAVALGGELDNLNDVYHGIETPMHVIEDCPIYKNIESPFNAGRYHSWVAKKEKLPVELVINCTDKDGQIMGLHHKQYPVYGVQFHPESIMTPSSNLMLENFLNL